MISLNDALSLARAGGVALAIALGVLILIFWRALTTGLVEWGDSVKRERELLTAYGEQMRDERDQYRLQVEARQAIVDQALDKLGLLTELLRDLQPPSRRRRDSGAR